MAPYIKINKLGLIFYILKHDTFKLCLVKVSCRSTANCRNGVTFRRNVIKTLCKTRCEKIVLRKRFWNTLWDRRCWKDVVRKSILRKTFLRKTLWDRRCEKDVVRKTLGEHQLWERRWEKDVGKTLWESLFQKRRCEKDVLRK